MGNSEGRNETPRNKSHKGKVPHGNSSPGSSEFYYAYDSDGERYQTCRPDVPGSVSKDVPVYYFTASQLRNAKKKSASHDAGLNRRSSVIDCQKTDVRDIVWPAMDRKNDTFTDDDSQYLTADERLAANTVKPAATTVETNNNYELQTNMDDTDQAYVTASSSLMASSIRSAVNDQTTDDLMQRVEKFNNGGHGLHINKDSSGILLEVDLPIHMHLVSAVTMHMPLTLRDIVSPKDAEYGRGYTVTFCLPPGTTKSIHITSKDHTADVICLLLKKFNITDSPSQFVLYEKDISTKVTRRLRDDDLPLLLCLVWSEMYENVLDRKQFVLKETRSDAVEWDAFSEPELKNFLVFYEKEEQYKISLIRQNCYELKHRMTERMKQLSAPSKPVFGQSGDGLLY